MELFNRLAPYIQDYIYRNEWVELRDVQVAACDVIFNTDKNLLLSSGTASGKTEAAFLPALTCLYENSSSSVGILYISPLKALINDQFIRLEYLLSEANIPVCKWHGDASITAKNKLLKNPQGILQITPESLESLLMNKQEDCIGLFSDLRFVIIDEVHNFMDSPRGIQLLCQLERIQNLSGCIPRRIGLSATLGDYSLAEEWINSGSNRSCITPKVNGGKRKLSLAMQRFVCRGDEADDVLDIGIKEHFEYLYHQTLNKKAIIFAKSRSEIEEVISNIRHIALNNKTDDVYHVHHGNISALLREDAENDMKTSEKPIVTGATVTLELGMDIGSLDRVVQVGSPLSVSSFTQRIGRCGRRGQPAELIFTFVDKEIDNNTDPMRSINWDYIKTIAIIQLYLEDRWVEPILPPRHPYALLYHQTMSYLVSSGEILPAILAQKILAIDVFKNISKDDYKVLLKHLIDIEHLQKTERGGLIIGRKAEKIVANYEFYCVFETPIEYLVKTENQAIGTVMQAFPKGSRFSLAGRAWESIDIQEKSKTIFVKELSGISKISWISSINGTLHTKLLRKMCNILKSDETPRYLSATCIERLKQIREFSQASGFLTNLVTPLSEIKFAIFPWLGTRQLISLSYALKKAGVLNIIMPGGFLPIYIEVIYKDGEKALNLLLNKICNQEVDKNIFELPKDIQIPYKYNQFIPSELLKKQYLEDYIDVVGMQEDIRLKLQEY